MPFFSKLFKFQDYTGAMRELYILPFDHRGSFMQIIKAASPPSEADITNAREYKKIIYDAFRKSIAGGVPKEKAGILVDEWLGREILIDAKRQGFITCTPLEKSGQDEFEFDREDWKEQLKELGPNYAKVLVRYNPEGDEEINLKQTEKLAELSSYLETQPYRFLFELLVPATKEQLSAVGTNEAYEKDTRPGLPVEALRQLHESGINPDIWKLEGVDTDESMQMVSEQVKAGNPDAGIIILGRGESAEKAEHWLRIGAKADNAIGFAVGRTVFKEALEQHAAGKTTREQAVNKISENNSFFVDVWKKVKPKI